VGLPLHSARCPLVSVICVCSLISAASGLRVSRPSARMGRAGLCRPHPLRGSLHARTRRSRPCSGHSDHTRLGRRGAAPGHTSRRAGHPGHGDSLGRQGPLCGMCSVQGVHARIHSWLPFVALAPDGGMCSFAFFLLLCRVRLPRPSRGPSVLQGRGWRGGGRRSAQIHCARIKQ